MTSSSFQLPEGPPTLTTEGSVATITLRRPSQRNSLHDEDLRVLLRYFAQLDADVSVRVLVLRAATEGQAKPVFSAGYFVGGFEAEGHDPSLFEQVPQALARMRPITVCALQGSVYGGATDLMLACDLRLGLLGAEFRMPATALGLHYYPSGLRRYVSRLGLGLAQQAFLTARALPI
jgi:enoyl-CoA hydratase/carnithine racemase